MYKTFPRVLTFDDVALVPNYNNVASRTEPDLKTWLTTKSECAQPMIPSNMDTVIGIELATIMLQKYRTPIIAHRFMSYEDKCLWINRFGRSTYMSCGVRRENLDEMYKLIEHSRLIAAGQIKGVCFDIAHGHSKVMIDCIKEFKDKYPELEIIAGNVCTARAYHDLANAGADAIKVGVGSGAACLTRMVTGFGVSQFSAIQDCAEVANELRVPLIADGGVRDSRDVVLSLAAGASTVMSGKLFAAIEESAAEKRKGGPDVITLHNFDKVNLTGGWESLPIGTIFHDTTKKYAKYRGQASKDFQDEFYGGLKEGTVPEGDSSWIPVTGTVEELMNTLHGGLRSGLTYGGARNIKELQRKAKFVEVTNTYMNESKTRL